jgi:hypothetical protein
MNATADIARELGCEVRQFPSLRKCVTWYLKQKIRRRRMTADWDGSLGGACVSRDSFSATYAAVSKCLESQHMPCDVIEKFGPITERVVHLACWYEMSVERGEQFLADQLGMSPRTLAAYCELTESIIRRRLRERGLLEERPR